MLGRAYDACAGGEGAATLSGGDGGKTIVIDTGSKSGSVEGVQCVWAFIGTPQSIIASVASTTAMAGTQRATADGLSYSWSYHPDNGLNMVITEVQG